MYRRSTMFPSEQFHFTSLEAQLSLLIYRNRDAASLRNLCHVRGSAVPAFYQLKNGARLM